MDGKKRAPNIAIKIKPRTWQRQQKQHVIVNRDKMNIYILVHPLTPFERYVMECKTWQKDNTEHRNRTKRDQTKKSGEKTAQKELVTSKQNKRSHSVDVYKVDGMEWPMDGGILSHDFSPSSAWDSECILCARYFTVVYIWLPNGEGGRAAVWIFKWSKRIRAA